MPGWSNGTNKFGPSDFVVGTALGAGVNYTSIQTAIDDCFAIGGGSVLIRPGAYIENLTLRPAVEIIGVATTGIAPTSLNQVQITGNHVFTGIGGLSSAACQNIRFITLFGNAFTVNAVAPGFAALFLRNSGLDASADPTSVGFVLDAIAGSQSFVYCENVIAATGSSMFDVTGAGNGTASIHYGQYECVADDFMTMTAGIGTVNAEYATIRSNDSIMSYTIAGSASDFEYCSISSNNECFLALVGAPQTILRHCTVSSNAASGNFIDGVVAGTLYYGDIILQSSAAGIGATISAFPEKWRPWAESGVGPAPSALTVRGTSCYDSGHFTVTDGFVELKNPFVPFNWVDQGASTTVVINQGNFVTAAITLTLPAVVTQGDTVEFKLDSAGPVVIQAVGAQTIRLGASVSSAAGTATSTAIGDALTLTYRSVSDSWIADSIIGNWTIA